ncbi:hypothetical protein L1887_11858 [Cichorium endivia]|nr:hypothetical protein L1887_11858 [Cichorium endivia]
MFGLNALKTGGVQAPTPATLRITDGRQGRAEAPKGKGRAFQLTAEEACTAPDVVTGTFLSYCGHGLA